MEKLEVKKIKTKPVIKEAVQYFDFRFGSDDPFWDWMTADCEWQDPDGSVYGLVLNNTPNGDIEVNDGDWIIKGVDGGFYPCPNDVFEKTYDFVEE